MEVLQAKDLKKIYGSGNNTVHALDGVDLSVKKGEFVAIVGTSGSGKSTLLHMLGGLDRPTSGTVMVDGQVRAVRFRERYSVIISRFPAVHSFWVLLSETTAVRSLQPRFRSSRHTAFPQVRCRSAVQSASIERAVRSAR